MIVFKVFAVTGALWLASFDCAWAQPKAALPSRPYPGAGAEKVEAAIDIEPVWAGHPVSFALLTRKQTQFVAYYDAQRAMTVAQRALDSKQWHFKKLPTSVVWDSHNYIAMTLDRADCLHISGNMHCVPLIYLRSAKPIDASTLERIPNMIGPERELRVTYPVFFRDPQGALVYKYRDGRSGSGDDLYNIYDESSKTWKRLLATPLAFGQGKMNAYCQGPLLGPDGVYHLAWVWRDTPDAATNHHLSYARSRDLTRWENGAGKPLTLPITIASDVVVDPTGPRKGMLNPLVKLGFDALKRPVITYHKYDATGNSQIYNARLEAGQWRIYQTSDWSGYRYDFGGGGSLPDVEVRHGGVAPLDNGNLALSYLNKNGGGLYELDGKTLKPVGLLTKPRDPLASLRIESKFPGMGKKNANDLGQSDEAGTRYELTWETLGANRDRAREGPLPEPSMLRVVKIIRQVAEIRH
ncbi:MAG: BNR repeat-containing protein [Candidatus Sumerlaeota bacterium]|nr:BNR repeat-containing protein [Candidatus Sumerlaeota bacterium]